MPYRQSIPFLWYVPKLFFRMENDTLYNYFWVNEQSVCNAKTKLLAEAGMIQLGFSRERRLF